MKKTLYAMLVLALAAVTFTSCSEEDDLSGSYTYYEPIMTWGISEADVRSQMSKSGDWKEVTDRDAESEGISFRNSKSKAEVNYHFDNEGKYESFTVYYYGCNKDFGKMKSDWAKAFNLKWESKTIFGMTFDEAKSESVKCDFITMSGVESGIEYMYVTGMYEPFIW